MFNSLLAEQKRHYQVGNADGIEISVGKHSHSFGETPTLLL